MNKKARKFSLFICLLLLIFSVLEGKDRTLLGSGSEDGIIKIYKVEAIFFIVQFVFDRNTDNCIIANISLRPMS